ncbi:dimethylsulfonioproprionate lyase family protein [Shinella sp. S4-D37]|uniref:dimethylsulfonioproprionate lyase family protein n=1 Tax=Shinella sp. S4-D37 TaxID=3161999 RepID=UPI00346558B0
MTERPAALGALIDAARDAYSEFATDPRSRASITRIFDALHRSTGAIEAERMRLPVCSYLPSVAANQPKQATLRTLVDAFVSLEPQLSWRRRSTWDAATASDNFHDGHGNCMIIGPGGFENRSDLGLGVSLLAPNVRYPDHDHAPEETYLVLSEGLFRQGDGNWFSPGVGGSFHNVPMIRHAMRSGGKPLLAFWALWMG